MRMLILFLCTIGLAACSSPPKAVNYYMLYTPQGVNQAKEEDTSSKIKIIKLNKILLADYLKQSSLAMQLDSNMMYFSRQDIWSEGLESSIFKALLADLNQDEHRQYFAYPSLTNANQETEVTVQIDHFHATDNANVVATGHFWLKRAHSQNFNEYPFYFTLPLTENGFSNAVTQQRQLLRLLAKQIQQELTKLNE